MIKFRCLVDTTFFDPKRVRGELVSTPGIEVKQYDGLAVVGFFTAQGTPEFPFPAFQDAVCRVEAWEVLGANLVVVSGPIAPSGSFTAIWSPSVRELFSCDFSWTGWHKGRIACFGARVQEKASQLL